MSEVGIWQAIQLADHSKNPKHGEVIASAPGDGANCPPHIKDLWQPGRVAIGWTFNKPIKALPPETLAKRRNTRLRNKMAKALPLFAEEFTRREIEARPEFFQGR